MSRAYAVQSALAVAHFTPQDAQHIGYFEDEVLKVQLKVPFEVFKRKSGKGSGKDQGKAEEKTHRSTAKPASEPLPSDNFKVLLFWIEEEAIAQQVGGTAQPLQKLNALIQGIASKAPV